MILLNTRTRLDDFIEHHTEEIVRVGVLVTNVLEEIEDLDIIMEIST